MSKEEYEREWYQKNEQAKQKLYGISQNIAEMNGMANNVNVELCRQGEQLGKINTKLDQANHDIQYGEYIADGMKSFWTRMKQKIAGGFKSKEQKPMPGNVEWRGEEPKVKESGPTVIRYGEEEGDIYEEDPEIESQLDSINNQLDSLKYAVRMTGHALDYQKPQIEALTKKTDKNNQALQKLNKKVRYLADK